MKGLKPILTKGWNSPRWSWDRTLKGLKLKWQEVDSWNCRKLGSYLEGIETRLRFKNLYSKKSGWDRTLKGLKPMLTKGAHSPRRSWDRTLKGLKLVPAMPCGQTRRRWDRTLKGLKPASLTHSSRSRGLGSYLEGIETELGSLLIH